MRCRTPRKGPRRSAAKPPAIDQELADLASVIAEYSLDNNAYGWFRMPWRDGWNAVGLALDVCEARQLSAFPWLRNVYEKRSMEPELYWMVAERMEEVVNLTPYARAALRCLQVLIANSSGGGHAYNAILIPAFMDADPETVSDDILEHRCRDSIGTTAQFQGDPNDRQRGAFRTAWKRGLYMAAYSLPPATVRGQIKVVK